MGNIGTVAKNTQSLEKTDLNFSRSSKHAARVDVNPAVIHHGRNWKIAGGVLIGVGVLSVSLSILSIITLTTPLGSHVARWGATGSKLVNWMGSNANSIMIAGLAASGGGLVLTFVGGGLVLHGKHIQKHEELKSQIRKLQAPLAL